MAFEPQTMNKHFLHMMYEKLHANIKWQADSSACPQKNTIIILIIPYNIPLPQVWVSEYFEVESDLETSKEQDLQYKYSFSLLSSPKNRTQSNSTINHNNSIFITSNL